MSKTSRLVTVEDDQREPFPKYRDLWIYRMTTKRKQTLAILLAGPLLVAIYLLVWFGLYVRAEMAFNNMPMYRSGDEINAYYDMHGDVDLGRVFGEKLGKLKLPQEMTEKISIFNRKAEYPFDVPLYVRGGVKPIGEVESIGEVEAMPGDVRAAAEGLLKVNGEVLDYLDQLPDDVGAARFPSDFNEVLGPLMPHLRRMRSLTRLIKVRIVLNYHDEDHETIFQDLKNLVKLSRMLEAEPHQISQLVRVSINAKGTYPMISVTMGHEILDQSQLEKLLQMIRNEGFDLNLMMTDAILSDAFTMMQLFDELGEVQEYVLPEGYLFHGFDPVPFWQYTHVKQIDRYKTVQLYAGLLDETQNQTYQYSKMEDQFLDSLGDLELVLRSTSLAGPAYRTLCKAEQGREGMLKSLKDNIYYFKHGKYPEDEMEGRENSPKHLE
ncbi:hypothetical protein KS4_30720 [Poriferisphaera corsica]|uniref:Uncharacterized protein n=1 Tax=Poriferisphaera corsica TaxID=2528020 RepID=A0A517YXP3_9BACT|nr:hypothetical protein [Poriferisphaera corsica]QDU34995.1 hypothetical protein KS4_30720 [Poriferisphaera corsica]